ncbi:MAG: Rieske 2Fe-2S domain-containing protein, partial [Bdellovibrionota bacterium]|nr:Rieske 2Fe-2S domain-containing protein [Bdellovibrionota bacterium]
MEPLKERDGHLINNWYVACLTRELKKRPIQRILYDEPVVLFRNSAGQVTCFPDRCLHRHVFLSQGEVLEGNLICPYHGWIYDQKGEVV